MIGKQTSKQQLRKTEVAKPVISYLLRRTEGFTIVESLIAIVVVSILLVAIAPVLSLSVATRVQSRRVELATQAAKAYIDAVRTQKVTAPTESGTYTPSTNPAPTATGTLTCTANSYCTAPAPTTSQLYCVDLDSSNSCEITSLTDMVVQAFRYNPNNSNSNNAITGYTLGLRVYRADAFKGSTTLLKNNPTKTTQNPFTGGIGQRTAPLVEMTADISDTVPKYSDLCARFTGGCSN
ncbi:type II secretion system protein [Nostoc sp. FACHB-152]|uniref:hormogonium polysaccharide secretion pseudopilin HpsB n=1 Tax=unclassified Nostoc TaxID=2593658 RepID=UPI0016896831|nr:MULTISPECIES: hormogonium polysaccharide secretion pseudopilin HpsB [unclassified Nostoc]MBD2448458.1 type II secretion system protein [Nostoc sp. FACHB-152]MBD2466195.1 type II secretion system protein [Nostoc sp. FACHB-145]